MTVITRFPPSPTGLIHIGSARTALFNWLYAKHHNGKFVVRIEDTDRKRYDPSHVDAIKDALKWLELDHDGDIVSQFEQRDRHIKIAQQLLDAGRAYYCYCTPQELEDMREQAKVEGSSNFYDRRWRDKKDKDAPQGIAPVVRIKAPLDGETVIDDKVQGKITIQNETLDDFIILRSDGTPTYMLSVVVDDYDMGITHILRGDDHINNTFRQKVILDAMGWDTPIYAHLPLIHGPDGGKFSKRHGAQSVDEYRQMGYLPEAMRNYLLKLGWAHGNDEIISTEQAIEWFDLDGIGKSAAKFDFAKLENLNAHYIKEADNARLLSLILPLFKTEPGDIGKARLIEGMNELKDRAKTLHDIVKEGKFYVVETPLSYDDKAAALLGDDNKDILQTLYAALDDLEDFTSESIQATCKTVADELREGKLGKVAMPLRAALTGTTQSPSIFHAAEILGKGEVLARLKAAQ